MEAPKQQQQKQKKLFCLATRQSLKSFSKILPDANKIAPSLQEHTHQLEGAY